MQESGIAGYILCLDAHRLSRSYLITPLITPAGALNHRWPGADGRESEWARTGLGHHDETTIIRRRSDCVWRSQAGVPVRAPG